jgi:hypothetical protein
VCMFLVSYRALRLLFFFAEGGAVKRTKKQRCE